MFLNAKNEVYMPLLHRPFLRNGNNDPIHVCSLIKNFPSRKVINNFIYQCTFLEGSQLAWVLLLAQRAHSCAAYGPVSLEGILVAPRIPRSLSRC